MPVLYKQRLNMAVTSIWTRL